MDLGEALRALRAGWWLLVTGLLAGAVLALGLSLLQPKLYTANTQLFVSTTNSNTTAEVYQGSQFSEQRVTSYAQLLTGEKLAGRVATLLNLQMTPKQIAAEVTATPLPNTVLIDVDVTDPSPERAQRIAQAIGAEFPVMVTGLEAADQTGASPVKVTVTKAPDLPSSPSSPHIYRNVALGLVVGLLLGALVALARVRLDRSVKGRKEAAELAGVPLVGTIVRDDGLARQHVADRVSLAGAAENFRQLRTNLQFLDVDRPPKVIMISSPMPSEGKTTVVINLALALAEVGQRVAVVEADLRRSRLTRYLGLVAGVGLTNVLAHTAELDDVAQPYGEDKISVIGAGPTPPNPGQLLASGHMSALIEELRGKHDYVLIDAPPLLPVADSTGLAPLVDGVVLSVRYGRTRKDALQQAVATLDRVGGRVLGLILNIVPPKAREAGAYGYGYRYVEDEPRRGRRRQGGRRRAEGRPSGTAVSDLTS